VLYTLPEGVYAGCSPPFPRPLTHLWCVKLLSYTIDSRRLSWPKWLVTVNLQSPIPVLTVFDIQWNHWCDHAITTNPKLKPFRACGIVVTDNSNTNWTSNKLMKINKSTVCPMIYCLHKNGIRKPHCLMLGLRIIAKDRSGHKLKAKFSYCNIT